MKKIFGNRSFTAISMLFILSLIILFSPVAYASDGTEDTAFYAQLGSAFNDYTNIAFVQSDGGILIGGNFTSFDGTAINRFIRLNTDGTKDLTFNTNLGSGFNTEVNTILSHLDGKILIGGAFTSFNGLVRNRFLRINADGTDDVAFNVNLGTGFNNYTFADVIQQDDKIVIGGLFSSFNGNVRNRLVRLNADGTEDTAFYTNLGTGFSNSVYSTVLQSDGKILVGGAFTSFNGNVRNRLVRLNANGTEDTAFYTNLGTGFNNQYVYPGAVQSDGKILVGGAFTSFNGLVRNRLIRLNTDGTEDTAFYTNLGSGFNGPVYLVTIQPDGKILVGGSFTSFNGATRNYLVRLNQDGTEDTAFYTNLGSGFNSEVYATPVQSDGKIIVTGDFTSFNGTSKNYLVRLSYAAPLTPVTAPDLVPSSDSGLSDTDNLTSDTTPTFELSCAADGDLVTLYTDGIENGTVVCTGEIATVTATTSLGEGSILVTYTSSNIGGESSSSPALNLVIDVTAPQIAIDTLSAGDDEIIGTGEAGSVVSLAGISCDEPSVVVDLAGDWICTNPNPSITYNQTITVTATDEAGNSTTTTYTTTKKSSSGSVAYSQQQLDAIFGTKEASESSSEGDTLTFNTGLCPSELIISQFMRRGDRDGSYSNYQKGTISEVEVLQAHINRILAASYDQAAGPVDGIFGPLTKQGVERLQRALNENLNPSPNLVIDGIVGPFTREAINMSC